ncbi:MAG: 7-cyano-7-deazaguanine synthase QueC [Parachlamydiaceae bacterium]|nr:MAG: 7-cyano-7-deazaguanine synthase QueC [Parachlamydiaceae bacterium]
MVKAVVLLSGGLDSSVILALAQKQGRECFALGFNYGQRHVIELEHAARIAQYYQVPLRIVHIDPCIFKISSLVSDLSVPKNRSLAEIGSGEIPNTYVPARNTLFLAYAMGQAEMLEAQEIYYGPNLLDIASYPDCTPAFVQAFQNILNVGTKQAVQGHSPKLIAPLINLNKEEIIRQGIALNVPLQMTFSCYDPLPTKEACGKCDACILRTDGFAKVGENYHNTKSI